MRSHQKTTADYAVIAICPALIILMITSLVHFVMLCFYRGDYPASVAWILFCFIVAATLIARIAIEQGRAYAFIYAVALGGAVFLQFGQVLVVSGPLASFSALIVIGMLALIWWLADRVTFDCTVVDEAQTASGEGLISRRGLFGGRRAETADVALDGTSGAEATPGGDSAQPARRRRRDAGHRPGRSVLYLALASLPLFGLGQWLLPSSDAVHRHATWAMGLYLFATLTLLVTTSFLGLRRYLRQRGTEMPAEISVAWLAGGAAMVALMLGVSFLLPQPGRMVAAIEPPVWLTSPQLTPSEHGWGREGTGEAEGDTPAVTDPDADSDSSADNGPASEPGGAGEPGDDSSRRSDESGAPAERSQSDADGAAGSDGAAGQQSSGEQSGGEQSGGEQSGQAGEANGQEAGGGEEARGGEIAGEGSESDDSAPPAPNDAERPGEAAGDRSPEEAEQGGESSTGRRSEGTAPPPSRSPPTGSPLSAIANLLGSIGRLLQLLIAGVLLGVILLFAYKNAHLIARWWRDLLAMLRGEGENRAESGEAAEPEVLAAPPRPFASFTNPWAGDPDPRRAVVVTFQAAEAWGREQGLPRGVDETPDEFARRLAARWPALGSSAPPGAAVYNRVVYGRGRVAGQDRAVLEQLWQHLQSNRPPRTL